MPEHPWDPAASSAPSWPPETATDERQLIEAVLRHDRKAAAEFVERHADAVCGYVRHRLAPRLERADDLVQEVFLAALSHLGGFRGASSLRTWLLGIARHKVEDYYRQRLREPDAIPEDDLAEPADGRTPVDEHIDRARAAARTQRILRQLPEAYGVVLLWRYWENRSVRDIAAATGKTEKAVERLLARARARFRTQWNEVQR